MDKLLLLVFLSFTIKNIDGCIPMRIIDPITFPVTTTTFSPPSTCPSVMNEATIYIEEGVNLADNDAGPQAMPTRTCVNSAKGIVSYYNGVTPAEFTDASLIRVWVGEWLRDTCSNPCVCTSTACYTPMPGNPSFNPNIYLYPHCASPNDCFVALVFYSEGAVVNPLNPADMFNFASQVAAGTDVTDPSYPRITRIGCSSCPLMV